MYLLSHQNTFTDSKWFSADRTSAMYLPDVLACFCGEMLAKRKIIELLVTMGFVMKNPAFLIYLYGETTEPTISPSRSQWLAKLRTDTPKRRTARKWSLFFIYNQVICCRTPSVDFLPYKVFWFCTSPYKFSLRSKRKGKGRGGRGTKNRRRKGRGGLGRREGKGALAATLLFSSLRLLSHYPIKMKPNWFVYFCFRVNCLTSAHVQEFLHIVRYTNVDDKR